MNKKKLFESKTVSDLLYSIGCFATFVFFLLLTPSIVIPEGSTTAIVNGRTFPYLFCGLGAVLSLALIYRYARRLVLEKKGKVEKVEREDGNVLKVFLCIVSSVIFIFLTNILGVIVAGWIYIASLIAIIMPKEERTKKNIIIALIVTIVTPFAIYFPFRYLFRTILPMGIFKGLF